MSESHVPNQKSKIENQNSTSPAVLDVQTVSQPAGSTSPLGNFLNNGSYRVKEERALIQRRTVEPATNLPSADNPYECVLSLPPTATARLGQRTRNGKIARLPKPERDLVNQLLHNNTSYSQIVWALEERGITVTERNISNWRTRGGYKEWCAEQENQRRLAHLQDHLTDYLRKHDAQQLPEVGLQVAATQLTSLLMNPQTAAALLADPNKYARIVDSLDKCSARLKELQNDRYENVRRATIRNTVPNARSEDARQVELIREIASAEKLGRSAAEDNIPHRNHLPPREAMPYFPPGPTFADLLGIQLKNSPKTKQLPDSPSAAAQPVTSGNQTETHGNPR
ncbi:MAG TPA: hypothetical protein VG167_03550 [Verrucomicrobiae bacterium]|nr:hypothetical protein [Verrucomicrobiae bacterium]